MPERDAPPSGPGWLARLRAMPNDSPRKTLLVTLALCVVCSVAVAGASVLLKPRQERNKALAVKTEILEVAGLLAPGQDVERLFRRIDTRIVDLETGQFVPDIDPGEYSQREAARDPQRSVPVPPEEDIAKIGRRAKYAPVYLVREEGRVKLVILPVHGYGLWSTMYAFVALAADARTVEAITFYEHGETPGLGAEVENPKWRALWHGKLALDEDGRARFEVKKGAVDPDSRDARYQVDGLAGATLTANGVTNLIRYWLGDQGFGPFLRRIRSGERI